MTFTLQACGKILKCLLLRVNESKPPNSFSIMIDISTVMMLVPFIDRGTGQVSTVDVT